ncbi:MAG TPA: FUSC family protein [Rhodocyclaceae bacterium]|jgi:uncharacterized membrane protein YccC|nr:FUSC family protein [Rhodocyclaceae bacterium]
MQALFDARRVDEIECIVSVLLAIGIAHLLHAPNASWAAFAAYMVMRGHVADSLLRAVLRIAGTIIGAGLGLLLVSYVEHSPLLSALALGIIGAGALYGAVARRYTYAWLFLGLTFAMVLLDKLEVPGDALSAFVANRILETLAGSVACVSVSALSTFTLRRYFPAKRMTLSQGQWDLHAMRHALQCGLTLMLLPFIGTHWKLPDLTQSAVTIMAVMLIPLGHIQSGGFVPISRRLFLRAIGCLSGAAFAAIFLLLADGRTAIALIGLAIGVGIGRHIENDKHSITYMGVQFTLAVLVVLAPDSYLDANAKPGLERLLGILLGMALLEPMLLAWHLVSRWAVRIKNPPPSMS